MAPHGLQAAPQGTPSWVAPGFGVDSPRKMCHANPPCIPLLTLLAHPPPDLHPTDLQKCLARASATLHKPAGSGQYAGAVWPGPSSGDPTTPTPLHGSCTGGAEAEEHALRLQLELHDHFMNEQAGSPQTRSGRARRVMEGAAADSARGGFPWSAEGLLEAYRRCGVVTAEHAKTFYLGTQLMTPEKARAIWAIYVWCRRTDELVDGPNASRINPAVSVVLLLLRWGIPMVTWSGGEDS